jgi:hypothetical protein
MALTDGPMDLAQIGGGVAQAGIGAMTGNPIAIAAGVAGIAMTLFGGSQESKAQKEEAAVSAEIAGFERQINEQKRLQAGILYQRQTLENIRAAQMASHKSRAAAVNQGAQFGSGAGAGERQAGAEAAFNQSGLAQNYVIGQKIFGLTDQIDEDKMKLASLGGDAATGAGIASMGGALTSGAMALGRLTGGFGATN